MRKVISDWATQKIRTPFQWGSNDCRWILAEFLQLYAQWDMPKEIKALRGTYDNAIGALRIDRNMPKSVEECMADCGYKEVQTNHVGEGDIVKVKDINGFDVYFPVIYSQVVLVGDEETNKIKLANVYDLNTHFTTFRRT